MKLTPKQLAALNRLQKLKHAQNSFEGFVRLIQPDWDIPQFHLDLIETLDKFGKDQWPTKNLLITMPPRHSKSTYCTQLFPAWYMLSKPERYVMSSSYNSELAKGFGRGVRDLFNHPQAQAAFPRSKISRHTRSASQWATQSGGEYFGVGLGSTTTGRPANLLIVDDPIKSRAEAESMTQRNQTWDFYVSGLSTRLQPEEDGTPPRQCVVLTRWHPDDLAGRIMQSYDWQDGLWHHINLPAIRTETIQKKRWLLPVDHPERVPQKKCDPKDTTFPIEQEVALWPERFDVKTLKRFERQNPRDFAALYQQMPFVKGGNLFRTDWWQTYDEHSMPKEWSSIIIGVDTAYTKTSRSDYSVAVITGLTHTGDMYILDVIRMRAEMPDFKRRLINLNSVWRGRGLRGIYIEAGAAASGATLLQELRRETPLNVLPYKNGRADKVTRASSIAPFIEGGRVFLPAQAPWLDDFVEECTQFPDGKHDDQVDAMVIAIDQLSRQFVSPFEDIEYDQPSLEEMAKTAGDSLTKKIAKKDASIHSIADTPEWTGWGQSRLPPR
ncbi:MAG: phage terminase large subunit [Poseidonia sp.]